jgi:type II secretory ATPase GspE/PulE/Tfp pilus assembly ATPase PilB-like protein
MAMSASLRKLVMKGAGLDGIRDLVIQEGMLTLRDGGLNKVEGEITTLEEVVKETAVVF